MGGIVVSSVIAGTILGLVGLIAIVMDYRLSIYAVMLLGMFMFYINRLLPVEIPLGIPYELISGFAIIMLLFTPVNKRTDWKGLMNPISFIFLLIVSYHLIQAFNPNSTSIVAWAVSLRGNISIVIYILCFHYFRTIRDVKIFTATWLGLALVVAVYGLYQEVFGLTAFEWNWIYQVPERYRLYFIWGHMRKFSFLSDPNAFGLTMAFGGISCLVLSLGKFSTGKRLVFAASGLIMFVSMAFSGTRTSYAMVAVGIVFYILVTIQSKSTMIAAMAMVLIAGVILFGPIYGGTINRIRSTFSPSEDASMNVRDVKRISFQSYIQANPLGGGPLSAGHAGMRYSPGHPLAGEYDPDSGYLALALEIGWIGLILFLVLFGYVNIRGITEYYRLEIPVNKTIILAYIVPYFALSVAHFAQDAMFQRSLGVVIYATYAIVLRVPSFEKLKLK